MKSYPSLNYPGDDGTRGLFAEGTIVIQEKLDGANFRFTWDVDDGLTFGSRRTWDDGMNEEQFHEPIWYVDSYVDRGVLSDQRAEYGQLLYFGEAMMPHTISYDWEETPEFVGFDVWSVEEQRFLPTEEVYDLFEEANLPTAQLIDTVYAEDWDDYEFDVPESEYFDGPAEGVVFKNHDTDTYAKYVREDFKEKNKKTFGKPKKYQESGAEKLAYQYVTEARIEKQAYKLRDEGGYGSLQMEMMESLPEAVIRDMADEEAGNIFMGENWEIDTQEFRSVVSSRCAEILRRMIDKRVKEEL